MQVGVVSGFKGPFAIHLTAEKIYVSEWSRHQIGIFDLNFNFIKWFPETPLKTPHGISSDSENKIYITEYEGRAVHQYSADGEFIKTILSADQMSASWALSGPVKTVVNREGDLIVVDFNSDSLQKFSKVGKFLGWLGARSSEIVSDGWSTDISKRPSRAFLPVGFNHPNSLCLDRFGNIYVADTENHRVQKFSENGKFLGWIGSKRDQGHNQFTQKFELKGESQSSLFPRGFLSPICVDVDEDTLIVGEYGHPRIQKFSLDGEYQGWVGGCNWNQAAADWIMEGLSAPGIESGMFFHLYDVRLRKNKMYVADTYNSRIQVFEF
jgi:DNA-binding beta-propeller fold protein YncE